jgi:hypothetical protein
MALKDTIEDYVLEVLYEKIRLFEVAIGEMDLILSNMTTTESLDAMILEVIASAKDHKEVKRKLAKVSKEVEESKHTADEIRRFDEAIFREMDLSTAKSADAPDDEEDAAIRARVRKESETRRADGDDDAVAVEEGE